MAADEQRLLKRVRVVAILSIWGIPIASFLGCPSDLHGYSTCSSLSLAGTAISFVIASPGLMAGSVMSNMVRTSPYEGESFVAYLVGVLGWMVVLTVLIWQAPRLVHALTRKGR